MVMLNMRVMVVMSRFKGENGRRQWWVGVTGERERVKEEIEEKVRKLMDKIVLL